MSTTRVLYKIPDAAEQLSVSESTIRRAIRATDPAAFPPPLRAKRAGSDYRIEHSALIEWAAALQDA